MDQFEVIGEQSGGRAGVLGGRAGSTRLGSASSVELFIEFPAQKTHGLIILASLAAVLVAGTDEAIFASEGDRCLRP